KLAFQGRKNFSRDIYKPFSGFNPDETDFLLQIPLDDFPPDYYNVVVSVEDKNKNTLVQQGREFLVTPLGTISRPQTVFKATSLNRRAVTAFILGTQYMNVSEPGLALAEMEKAYNLNPRIQQFALGLSRLYLELKKYDKIETVLTPFLNPEKPGYQLYFLLGNANQKLGNYAAAVTRYTELMRYHGLSVGVLNSLASCYYNMGNKEEA
ncbi:MAG: hypothetical protein GY950_33280, partial [bacterium]|nr:hypothetical protein [bacterium]